MAFVAVFKRICYFVHRGNLLLQQSHLGDFWLDSLGFISLQISRLVSLTRGWRLGLTFTFNQLHSFVDDVALSEGFGFFNLLNKLVTLSAAFSPFLTFEVPVFSFLRVDLTRCFR